MKIVIPTDSYLPRWDGIARVMSEIVPLLAKKHEIEVIVPNIRGVPKYPGVKVTRIPMSKMKLGDFQITKFNYKKIKEIVKNADVVFTQTTAPIGLCGIWAAKKLHKPSVAYIHNVESELFLKALPHNDLKKIAYPIVKRFFRYMYNKCDLLLIPSEGVAEIISWQKIKTDKKIIQLGVDTNLFKKANRIEAKKKIGANPDDFIIGYHGRLGREKDLKTLLRAFNRIKDKNKQLKLMIVGEGLEEIEKLFINKEQIIFPRSQNNVIPYVQALDIYILPSLIETTSLTTLEAMACEVPVIVTKVGYLKDYIHHKENGLFFEKQNTFELAKRIEYLIKNPDIRKQMGKSGRKTVEQEFDWKVSANKMSEAIIELVNKKNNKNKK